MKRHAVMSILCLSACATTDETPEPIPCAQDWDCPAGQVCEAAEGGDSTCTAAAEGATRNFGEIALDFAGGTEVYLISVFSIPTAEAVSSNLLPFTLGPAAAADAQALHIRQGSTPRELGPLDLERSQFEVERRARIDAIVDEINTGARRTQSPARGAPVACSPACDNDNMCWQGECVAAVDLTLTAGGPTVSTHLVTVVDGLINVLVDDDDSGADTEAQSAAEAFAGTFTRELTLLGLGDHGGGQVDRDGDGRFTVVFTNATSSGAPQSNVGFFDPGDFLETGSSGATGNESDLLWVRVPGSTIDSKEFTELYAVGTMAHEYTHLASFATRVWSHSGDEALKETLWLDEGIAHSMEDFNGWGVTNVGAVLDALGAWNDAPFAGPEDLTSQRGKAYLLLRHIVEQRAGSASNAAASGVRTAAAGVFSELLHEEALGYQHAIFQNLGAEGMWSWLLAVYATGNDDVTENAAHAGDYLDTATDPDTDNLIGISPRTSMPDMRGDDVPFEGPEVSSDFEDVSDAAASVESEVIDSGAIFYVVSGGTGTVTLRGNGDAQADLRVQTARIQ